MTRALRLAVVLLLSLLALNSAAAGPSAADERTARQLFDQGKQAIARGQFERARVLFSRSLQLVPRASAAFNLAVACRGVGRPRQAASVLSGLLRGRYGELSPARAAEAKKLAVQVRREIAKLRVELQGAQRAELSVDGERVGVLVAGRPTTLELDPGEHVLSARAKLRATNRVRVTLAPGAESKLEIALELSQEARLSNLVLVASQPDAEVEVVGVARAHSRLERRLPPGKYRVRVWSKRGSSEQSVELKPATEHRIVLDVANDSVFESPWFWLIGGTLTAGAVVGGYFLFRSKTEDPVDDPEYGVVQTLQRF